MNFIVDDDSGNVFIHSDPTLTSLMDKMNNGTMTRAEFVMIKLWGSVRDMVDKDEMIKIKHFS